MNICLLDARKAFDKVHCGKLFQILIDMGASLYTDDITISCPTLYGLNVMLDICINTKKTVCIKCVELIKTQYDKLDW